MPWIIIDFRNLSVHLNYLIRLKTLESYAKYPAGKSYAVRILCVCRNSSASFALYPRKARKVPLAFFAFGVNLFIYPIF